jgi:hypothetical protein
MIPEGQQANELGTHENINYGQNVTIKETFPFATSGHVRQSFQPDPMSAWKGGPTQKTGLACFERVRDGAD